MKLLLLLLLAAPAKAQIFPEDMTDTPIQRNMDFLYQKIRVNEINIANISTSTSAVTASSVTAITQNSGAQITGVINFISSTAISMSQAGQNIWIQNVGVTSITTNGNNATYGVVDIASGTGISLAKSGQSITITNAGLTSITSNGLGGIITGAANLVNGTGISMSQSGNNITINSTAGGSITSDGNNEFTGRNNFGAGLGLGLSTGTNNGGAVWMYMQSVDGATQSSGCVVTVRMSGATDTAYVTFTSTIIAVAHDYDGPGGVLLESCAPASICKVAVLGPVRVRQDSSTTATAGNHFANQGATRCRAYPTAGSTTSYSFGRYMADVTANNWVWVWLTQP